jgi:hypothetical protein
MKVATELLRVRLSASGGARAAHVLPYTLRALRSGGRSQAPARYALRPLYL